MPQTDLVEPQSTTQWFSKSKTRAPKFSIPLVDRQRLLSTLDSALDKAISCIVAPAGFGKSTLLSQWRESLTTRGIFCAWINLDENDAEIRQFFAYLVFAIEDAGISLGYLKQSAENGFADMSSSAITTSLLSAIIDIEDLLVLILDDYHRTKSEEIDNFVKTLSEQCGDKVHIAIASRDIITINLSSLIAAGNAIEIPFYDLRFSDDEVKEAIGEDLDDDTVNSLQDQLEGWPVAVQMTRLMNYVNGVDVAKIQNRKIASHGHLANYLVHNVLQIQPMELQNFLLETSILGKFNADLADSVCDHKNSQLLIQKLQSLQALVVPLDDNFEWFRYHHLFSDCLKDLLKKDDPVKFDELHRRAARWCGDNRMVAEAVEYANRIKDYALSRQIINKNCEWIRAEKFGGIGYFKRLLENIPDEEVKKDPRILYSKAYCSILVGDFKLALQYQNAAEAFIEQDGLTPDLLRDRLTIGIGLLFRTEQKRDRHGKWLLSLLELIEQKNAISANMDPKVHILCCLTLQSLSYGDFDKARQFAGAADVFLERVISIYCEMNLGLIELWTNSPELAEHHFRNAEELAIRICGGQSNLRIMCAMFLIASAYWQSDLDSNPIEGLDETVLQTLDGDGGYDVYAVGFQVAVHHALYHGEFGKAETLISELEKSTERLGIERVTQFAQVVRLEFLAASDRLGQADRAYQKVLKWFDIDHSDMEDHGWFQWVSATYACARYLKAIKNPDEALRYVEAGLEIANALDIVVPKVRGNVLKASILENIDDRIEALTVLENTIAEGARISCVKAFAGEVSQALMTEAVSSVLKKNPEQGVKDFTTKIAISSAENLFSNREKQVLEGIAKGKSNKEIARELDLTDNTIKFHLRNIFRKMGVKKRVIAVEKGRELGILF